MITTHINTPHYQNRVTSNDGTSISYYTMGSGPGLILVHGALSMAADYNTMAECLGKDFTVYAIDRRGRGLSGPQGKDYSIIKECEDVAALQKKVNAKYLFGHSYGGLVVLETARNNQNFKRIAVYEPGVSVDGAISMSWMPAYQKFLSAEKYLDAFAAFSIGAGPEKAQKLPLWLMKIMLRIFIKRKERQQLYGLLPANLLEHIEVGNQNNTNPNYREVQADVLLMHGGKSGLRYVSKAIEALTKVLPSSQVKEFPKLDHFGPDKTAPAEVAQAVRDYFLKG
jgi:pimeloyl-ACP methyl ester carboxylesterase